MNKNEQIKFIEEHFPATTHHISNRRVRHTIFTDIQTELLAYLLGFYTADGSIDEKRKTFRIELLKGDCEIVYLFKDIISPDARIYSTKERTFIGPKGKEIHAHGNIGVDITSSELCSSLVSLNIGYRKSYEDLHIPNIPEHLIKHFIRGYFDGDGCICGYIKHDNSRNSDSFVKQFDFTSKTASILVDIQKFFAEHDIKISLNYLKRDNLYRLRTCSKKEVAKIFDLLYSDSNFYLSRKFVKFNHYVNTEVTLLIAEYRNALEMRVNESNNSPKSTEHSKILNENIC